MHTGSRHGCSSGGTSKLTVRFDSRHPLNGPGSFRGLLLVLLARRNREERSRRARRIVTAFAGRSTFRAGALCRCGPPVPEAIDRVRCGSPGWRRVLPPRSRRRQHRDGRMRRATVVLVHGCGVVAAAGTWSRRITRWRGTAWTSDQQARQPRIDSWRILPRSLTADWLRHRAPGDVRDGVLAAALAMGGPAGRRDRPRPAASGCAPAAAAGDHRRRRQPQQPADGCAR